MGERLRKLGIRLDLAEADLVGAVLAEADLTGALLAGANLAHADLSAPTLARPAGWKSVRSSRRASLRARGCPHGWPVTSGSRTGATRGEKAGMKGRDEQNNTRLALRWDQGRSRLVASFGRFRPALCQELRPRCRCSMVLPSALHEDGIIDTAASEAHRRAPKGLGAVRSTGCRLPPVLAGTGQGRCWPGGQRQSCGEARASTLFAQAVSKCWRAMV
ncbi:pentapeptide repeat-containing protein [Streptomyces sp. NPDC057336]|uniref:pentapeptide repeat-containing protein n=1 Tax=Streptomyces sp. NPDC057336 TaxID=3346102 RepID=UPI0036373D66